VPVEACPRDVRSSDRRQFHTRHATLLHNTVPAGPMNFGLRCSLGAMSRAWAFSDGRHPRLSDLRRPSPDDPSGSAGNDLRGVLRGAAKRPLLRRQGPLPRLLLSSFAPLFPLPDAGNGREAQRYGGDKPSPTYSRALVNLKPRLFRSPATIAAHKRAHAPQQTASLFDHLVGKRSYRVRHSEIHRLGGFQVKHEQVARRPFNWQVGGFCALEYAVGQRGGTIE
jgi:hypothetical protein